MAEIDLQKAETIAPFIGQDFLTWLWYFSEQNNGSFQTKDQQDYAFYLEQRISVQGGEGESKDTAVSSGPQSELREAKLGLQVGKKVNQAKIKIEQDENLWQVQVKAEDFSLTGFKTPKVEMKHEEGEDPDARFLEKVYLIEKAIQVLDELFLEFLGRRLSDRWDQELKSMQKWITSSI